MGASKHEAVVVANRLHQEDRVDYGEYSALMDGLEEIDPLKDRDAVLEDLWADFADVPMNPETECIEQAFLSFPAGTHREDIWHWFDERHSKGVAYLLGQQDEGQKPCKCFVVIDSSYDVGMDLYAFWSREDAEQSIREDVQTTVTSLKEEGYEGVEVLEQPDRTDVYIPDTDIYYEWAIHEVEVE